MCSLPSIRGEPFVGGLAVIDDQDAALQALLGDRLALGALDADLARSHRAHAQFVGHHLQPGQRTHARDQRDVGDRLGEEIVGARLADPATRSEGWSSAVTITTGM